MLEPLEDRMLLAVISWNVDASGSWAVAGNWRDEFGVSRLPTAGDDVFLDRPAGPFTITHSSGSDTVRSLHAENSTLVLSSGSLAFSAGGEIDLAAGLFQWTGGTLAGGVGVVNAGGITLAGAATKTLTGTLNNAGTIAHGGTGGLSIAGTLNNLAGGLYDLQGDLAVSVAGAFNNSGTFRKSSGNGSLTLRPFISLGGTLEVRSGTIRVDGQNANGTQFSPWTGGNFLVAAGAFLDWVGDDSVARFPLSGTYTGSGEGKVRFGSGTLRFGSAGGTFHFADDLFQWNGGSIECGSTGLTNLGTLNLTGSTTMALTGLFTNRGHLVHTGTGLFGGGNTDTFINDTTGIYDLRSDASLNSRFTFNRGILRKSGGPGTSAARFDFSNEGGTIEVQTGIFQIQAPFASGPHGSSTGATFLVATGAALDLAPVGATVRYTGTYTGSGGGKVRLAGTLQIGSPGATFNFPSGMLEWTSGAIQGGNAGLNNVGTITLVGTTQKNLTGLLTNAGIINHTGSGNLHFDVDGAPTAGTLQNQAGSLYDFQGDGNFTRGFEDTAQIKNAGVIRKSAGTGTSATLFGMPLHNLGGTIDIRTGTFRISAGNHTGGTFSAVAGATLKLIGDQTIAGTFTGSGNGIVQLGERQSDVLRVGAAGATFLFSAGLFQWAAGRIEGGAAGLTNRGVIAVTNIDPDFHVAPTIWGTLNNEGIVNSIAAARLSLSEGGTFNNRAQGTYDFQGDGTVSFIIGSTGGPANFHNFGLVQKSSGSGTALFGTSFFFSNSGTLKVATGTVRIDTSIAQISGTTLTGGTWQASAGATLDLASAPNLTANNGHILLDGPASTLTRISTLASNTGSFRLLGGQNFATTGAFSNTGHLTVGAGSTLNVPGAFTQSTTGAFDVQVGGTPSSGLFGRLNSTGSATLAGALTVSLVNGFGPSVGQTFPVMNFAGQSGSFDTVNGTVFGAFPLFQVDVTPTNVILSAQTTTADLAFDSFTTTFPTSASLGQNVAITYTVRNVSNVPATGDWFDSVYLSRDGVLDPGDVLLGRLHHVGAVPGLGAYTETLTGPLPALVDGGYHVLVIADSRGLVPDPNRPNNTGVSAATIAVTLPVLLLGTTLTGTISPGQDLYYRLFLPPGRDVTLAADFAVAPGAELYLRYRDLPDRSNFDHSFATGDQDPRLLLANPSGGSYYVLIHGRDDAAGPSGFTLSAAVSGFAVVSVSPEAASNQWGLVQLAVEGSQFTPQTRVTLRRLGGAERQALDVEYVDGNLIRATFDLTGLPVTNYQVIAEDTGSVAVANRTFQVNDIPASVLDVSVQAPPSVGVGGLITLVVSVTNNSTTVRRPFVVIQGKGVEAPETTAFSFKKLYPGQSDSKQLVKLPVPVANGLASEFNISIADPSPTPIDWETRKNELRPSTIPADAWNAIWPSFKTQLGLTQEDLQNLLDRDTAALAPLGAHVDEFGHLFHFELQKANGQMTVPVPAGAIDAAFPAPGLPLTFGRGFATTIAGRFRLGRLGRGWVDSFDFSLSEDNTTGQVTVRAGASFRSFFRQGNGTYFAYPGDQGALVKVNGVFQVREASGGLTTFRSDGLLDYFQDANNNRLTFTYTGSVLTRVTHDNGIFLQLDYNGQGRIRQVIDPNGDIASYTYDASGEHLLRVTTTAGTTEYSYSPDATGPRTHALASIAFLDGTHLFFQYNARGWLAQEEADGGVGRLRITYGANSVSATNADNQTATSFFDNFLRVRKVQDPLGRISTMSYDDGNNLVNVSSVGGGAAGIEYDSLQNPKATVNPLGEGQGFTYELAHNHLDVFSDALGHTTDFDYDLRGNPTAVTYANGSAKQFGYDAQGNLTRSVDRLGQTITYTYNSRGQTTRKDLPGGAHVDYTYNARGNLETAVDASGTTRLEYLDPQVPDLLTKITHPSGRFLQYAYTNNRRTRMVDQSGFAVHYAYDAAGRLEFLRDGSNNTIVQYRYDAVGRLDRQTNSNRTVTEYEYYDDGQLRTITNFAPDASVQSQLTYTYDNLSRRRSVTTAEGTTGYDYDGAGRLTSVSLPGGRVIVYAYDAAGNRTTVTDSGVSTTYTVNALNAYTEFGATHQTFDLAGNLVATSGREGNTTYRYDTEGRLIGQLTPQGAWTYEYDVFGNRIASSLNGTRTQFLVDPSGNVVAEYDGNGNLQAHYVHGFGLTSRVDSANASAYYQFDAVGNTMALTGSDGAVLNSYSYLPFGEALTVNETVANPFEFVGEYGVMREGSGIDSMRYRWYAPEQGRFIQLDPMGLAGGANLYGYVGNAPTTLVDPSGLGPSKPILTIPAAVGYEVGFVSFEAAKAEAEAAYGVAYVLAREAGKATQAPAENLSADNLAFGNALNARNSASPATNAYNSGLNAQQAFSKAEVQAEVAAQRAATQSGGALGRIGGAVFEVLKGLISVAGAGIAIGQWMHFVESGARGELAPCVPIIPHSLQACEDPGDNSVIEEMLLDSIGQVLDPTGLYRTIRRVVLQLGNRDSHDPNDIVGPAGFGSENFVQPQTFPYTIFFENDPDARHPAAEVFVTQQLDPDLDLDTFELGDFGFGGLTVPVPSGRQFYHTRVDVRPTLGVFVDFTAELDRLTRTVTWTFTALDPATLDVPIDLFTGFLPPNDIAPEGQGFVTYSIRPRSGSSTGTRVDALASIVFDANAPILTPPYHNTLDAGRPTSSVAALPAVRPATFTVQWSGLDDASGSGIASYDIFVSDNNGPLTLWKDDITQTSASFTGQDGHTYAFFSLAIDHVGHQELSPNTPDAVTLVDATAPTILDVQDVAPDPRTTPVAAIDVVFSEPLDLDTFDFTDLTLTRAGGPNLVTNALTVAAVPGTNATYRISGISDVTSPRGTYELTVNAATVRDRVGNPGIGSAVDAWHNSVKPATTTTLSSSSPNSTFGQEVTFTARVEGSDGGRPVGIVTFKDGATVLGTATLDPTGRATLITALLSAGTHPITALYEGDDAFQGSASALLTQTVSGGVIDVSSQVTVSRGGFRYNRVTRRWFQTVTLTNSSNTAIQGPISLVLDHLGSNVRLVNGIGFMRRRGPLGSPYLDVFAGVLTPGQSVSVILEFDNPTSSGISYTPRVLAGSGER